MLRMVNLLMALSLGVHREQLLQRMGLTWPRPFLLRPLFFLCRCEHCQSFFPAMMVAEMGHDGGVLCADEEPQRDEGFSISASCSGKDD